MNGFDLGESRTRNAEGRRFDTGQLHCYGVTTGSNGAGLAPCRKPPRPENLGGFRMSATFLVEQVTRPGD